MTGGRFKTFLDWKDNRRKLENIVTADNFAHKQAKLLASQEAIYLKLKNGNTVMLVQTSLSDKDDNFTSKINNHELIPQRPGSDRNTYVAEKDNQRLPVQ